MLDSMSGTGGSCNAYAIIVDLDNQKVHIDDGAYDAIVAMCNDKVPVVVQLYYINYGSFLGCLVDNIGIHKDMPDTVYVGSNGSGIIAYIKKDGQHSYYSD
jgi:hypothetical protein